MYYTRNPFWQWETDASSESVGIILAIITTIAAILLTLLIILLKDLWRIYQTHAQLDPNSPTARLLWIALAGFAGIIAVCTALAVFAGAAAFAVPVAAWSFLVFVVVVEVADRTAPDPLTLPSGEGLLLGENVS